MFENELDSNLDLEFSELFGKKAKERRQERRAKRTEKREAKREGWSDEKRARRAKMRKAAGFVPPVALFRLGRKAVTGRKYNDFDGESISGLDI